MMRPSFAKRVTLALLLYTLSAAANPVPVTTGDNVTTPAECAEDCSSKFTETSVFTSSLQSSGDADVASTTDSVKDGTPTNGWPSSSGESTGNEKPTSMGITTTTMAIEHTESRISTTEFPLQTETPIVVPNPNPTISFDPPSLTTVPQTAHTEMPITTTGFPPPVTTTENPSFFTTIAMPIPHTESSVESGFNNPPGGDKPTSGRSPEAGHLPSSTAQNDANPAVNPTANPTANPFPINDGQPTSAPTVASTFPPAIVLVPSAPVQVVLPLGPTTITLAPDALPTPGGTTVIGTGSAAATLSLTTNAVGQTVVVVVEATATVGRTLTLTTVTTLPAAQSTGTSTPTKSSTGRPSSSSSPNLPSGAAPRLLDAISKEVWKAMFAVLILAVH